MMHEKWQKDWHEEAVFNLKKSKKFRQECESSYRKDNSSVINIWD